ncbi:MAG: TraR/DksA family transcriptional regulator [Rhizobiaceae bacterium]|nr:TraR/DksA family transcriptional regulator [Rhizobiaceae bacterium]
MPTIQERKEQLTQRLNELETRLGTIEHELDKPMSQDWEDRSAEREGDEVMESMGNSGLLEISMVTAALERIENGTYGRCTQCDNDILDARLDLLPHTHLCRNCANKEFQKS